MRPQAKGHYNEGNAVPRSGGTDEPNLFAKSLQQRGNSSKATDQSSFSMHPTRANSDDDSEATFSDDAASDIINGDCERFGPATLFSRPDISPARASLQTSEFSASPTSSRPAQTPAVCASCKTNTAPTRGSWVRGATMYLVFGLVAAAAGGFAVAVGLLPRYTLLDATPDIGAFRAGLQVYYDQCIA